MCVCRGRGEDGRERGRGREGEREGGRGGRRGGKRGGREREEEGKGRGKRSGGERERRNVYYMCTARPLTGSTIVTIQKYDSKLHIHSNPAFY